MTVKSRNWVAYNKRSKVTVKWLGCTQTEKVMTRRLKQYDSPKYVVPKKISGICGRFRKGDRVTGKYGTTLYLKRGRVTSVKGGLVNIVDRSGDRHTIGSAVLKLV